MRSSLAIDAIFETFAQHDASPTTELVFNSDFQLLIAVILSAQATDVSVNQATNILFKIAPNPAQMATLGETCIRYYIRRIGLNRAKAKNVAKTSAMIAGCYHGNVPDHRQGLEALPGVGRKTANVVLNTAFNQPTLAVDTHIFRVANRIGLASGKTVEQVEQQLLHCIPAHYLQNAHHWLILHGRYICTAKKPKCDACPIIQWCQYPDKIVVKDGQ